MSGPFGSSQWGYNSSTGFYSHTIDQSLRFDGSSSYLYFTPSSAATDSSKMTFSTWVKTWGFGISDGYILSAGSSYIDGIGYNPSHIFTSIRNGGTGGGSASGAGVRRDPSAWYHLYVSYDADAGYNRIYVNGVLDGEASTSSDLAKLGVNGQVQRIMRKSNASTYLDLYLAETHFVDGSIVPISTFAETKDSVWVPVKTSGITYGNNGWYLDYADSSDIGKDVSGRGNHWTSSGLAASDVVPDSPTNNFATMNPVYHSSSQAALLEGNLKVDGAGFVNAAHGYGAVSTFAIPKDKKIYIEVECTDADGTNWYAGFATQSGLESGPSSTNVGGASAVTYYNRAVFKNGTQNQYTSSDGVGGLGGGTSPLAAGDILGMAVDGSNGKVWFHKNGTYWKTISGNNGSVGNTGNPSAGSDELATIDNVPSEDLFVVIGSGTSASSIFVNFGQDSTNVASANSDSNGIGTFEYAVPTGYLCLCSSNMSDITIGPGQDSQADDYFNTVLYTGDGNDPHQITSVGFQPDWVWIKGRNTGYQHSLYDSVRGTNPNGGRLASDTATAENIAATNLKSFDTDGFTLSTKINSNQNTKTYVAWNWKAGDAPTTDNSNAADAEPTAGSVKIDGTNKSGAFSGSPDIPVTRLSANTKAGFSIVKYVGVTANPIKIPHGLNSAVEFLIIKRLDGGDSWMVGEPSLGFTSSNILRLEESSVVPLGNIVFTASPDTNVFTVGSATNVNSNTSPYIAYCLHSVEGYSKVGSYVGNGNADGTFVYTGFRPAWVMLKGSNTSGNWFILDTTRSTFNEADDRLNADTYDVEDTSNSDIDFLSNGFKIRTASTAGINQNTDTHLYLAFAEAPFKFANAR